jgi:hypothetical protein
VEEADQELEKLLHCPESTEADVRAAGLPPLPDIRTSAKSARRTGRGHPAEAGIMEVMSKSTSRRFPVTVTRLPVARCQICDRTVAYRPGKISEVLTEHYRRAHPETLGLSSR